MSSGLDDCVINVDHVSKKFARSLKKAMWYGLRDLYGRFSLNERRRMSDITSLSKNEEVIDYSPPALRPSEFWALKDVNFQVKRGECLGLIGHNGAGKSTLLSILSGIYAPTLGHVEIKGKLQSLIALGAGFHPMLSGRENIYINAAILGMTAKQVNRMLDQIIEFSELEDFIDAPIKAYSSGMLVRLGFSVAIHLDPDILLVDEVLAVGDLSFQAKCIEAMNRMLRSDKTIILVSHSPARVEAVSDRVLWLDHGQVCAIAEGGEVCAKYIQSQRDHASKVATNEKSASRSNLVNILRAECFNKGGKVGDIIWSHDLVFRVFYKTELSVQNPYFQIEVKNSEGNRVTMFSMMLDGCHPRCIKGEGVVECCVKAPMFAPGIYDIIVVVRGCSGIAFLADEGKYGEFKVRLPDDYRFDGPIASTILHSIGGLLFKYDWSWRKTGF